MSQKVAYVTGGMGGIGTAICQRLHKDGFKVIAGCGPSRDCEKWLEEQKALGFTFHRSVGNVADWDSTVAAFDKAESSHVAPEQALESVRSGSIDGKQADRPWPTILCGAPLRDCHQRENAGDDGSAV